YRENVYGAIQGTPDHPITIRGYPGEQAVIDGSLAEFFERPRSAWLPCEDKIAGTYRSARPYPNIRHLVGSFGDSMIGLQTYYHEEDLLAEREVVDWPDWQRQAETDMKPL